MHKKYNGYFTIEASFILPIVLFLYLLIILSTLFLYCRCVISQNNFLLGVRAGHLTWGEDDYGEVIYGQEQAGGWPAEDYVMERLSYKKNFYPLYSTQEEICSIEKERVLVQTEQKGSNIPIVKEVQRLNPVKIIREGRKKSNA